MVKVAFLFPGQGTQYVGMSKSFYDQFEVARHTFEEADDALGFDLSKLCFEGSLLDLNKMENMFPAIVASSIVTQRVYSQEIGVLPQFCAGHSLGEYSALVCAGVLSFSDALKIVRVRGQLAQQIVEEGAGCMTIIDNMDFNAVEEECKKISREGQLVGVSCYNSQMQAAVCGHNKAVQDLEDRVIELGGQITPLIGSAPFHSPLMNGAYERLKEELSKYKFWSFRYPVVSNVTGSTFPGVEKTPELLARQLTSPVRWYHTIKYLQKFGVTIAIEMSPKNLLSNLVKATVNDIETICFGIKEDRQALAEFLEANEGVKKHVPTVVTKCLAAVVATPNRNFDNDEFQKGVSEPYKRIQSIQDELDKDGSKPTVEQMRESLELLRKVFATKKVDMEEQAEWFAQILDETGTNHLFKDFCINIVNIA